MVVMNAITNTSPASDDVHLSISHTQTMYNGKLETAASNARRHQEVNPWGRVVPTSVIDALPSGLSEHVQHICR